MIAALDRVEDLKGNAVTLASLAAEKPANFGQAVRINLTRPVPCVMTKIRREQVRAQPYGMIRAAGTADAIDALTMSRTRTTCNSAHL